MTIEDSIKQLVATSLKRVEASIIASATRQLERPSTRLRPKLEQLEALPEGAAAYAWFDPEGATGRKYDAYAFKPWCASYVELLTERAEVSVQDLRKAVQERRVPRVSGAVQVLLGVAFEAARLLGRLDQDMEDRLG